MAITTRRREGVTDVWRAWTGPAAATAAQRLALLAICLLAWEIGARLIDSQALPTVGPTAEAALDVVPTEAFWSAVRSTLTSWAVGLAIAIAVAVPLGLVLGSNATAMRLSRGLVEFMRTVPTIMLVPLAVLMLGSTVKMKVVLILLAVVWPLLLHATYGIRDVDLVARESVGAFQVPWRLRVTNLYLPSAAPVIATGLRVAATIGLLISIGTEIITSAAGIGYEISLAQANGNAPKSVVYLLTAGVLGILISKGFTLLERRTLHWHASQRVTGGAA
jgi:ABC-type nitrate/sulfonate/bicarbonate transport system permease component